MAGEVVATPVTAEVIVLIRAVAVREVARASTTAPEIEPLRPSIVVRWPTAAPSSGRQHKPQGRATSPVTDVCGAARRRARGVYVGPRGAVVAGGHYGHYYPHVAPVRFYRPYYTFHPHLSVGFGLYVGYPFAYSYAFYNPFYSPYGYAAPYAYPPYPYPAPSPAYPPASAYPSGSYSSSAPQSPQASIGVQPGQQQQPGNEGGLSFDITPADAQLFIDGTLVGTVGQFTPTSQPLGLTAGRHHVEVRAQGYQSMTFDADIIAGQVIPYQGTMQR